MEVNQIEEMVDLVARLEKGEKFVVKFSTELQGAEAVEFLILEKFFKSRDKLCQDIMEGGIGNIIEVLIREGLPWHFVELFIKIGEKNGREEG